MSNHQIIATALTTFDVAKDGSYARLHMRDEGGNPATVVLPVDCLNQLLMSIPAIVQTAITRNHADETVRLTHPLEGFKLEYGELGNTNIEQFILTLHTTGGFAVAFSAIADNMAALANSILEELPEHRSRSSTATLQS